MGESLSSPWVQERGFWPSLVLLNQPNTTSSTASAQLYSLALCLLFAPDSGLSVAQVALSCWCELS